MAAVPPTEIKALNHTTPEALNLSPREREAFFADLERDAAESRRDHILPDLD